MDKGTEEMKNCPLQKANWFSRLFFFWLSPIFTKGRKQKLEESDMYDLVKEDEAKHLTERLEKEWNKELLKKKPSLGKAIIRTFGWQYAFLGIYVFLEEGSRVLQPVLLGWLIDCFADSGIMPGKTREAYLYATGLALNSIFVCIIHHPYYFEAMRIGMWIRVSSCGLIYKKVVRLKQQSLMDTTVGQIVNLMTNDVQRFDVAVLFVHFVWAAPLQAIVVIILLWQRLGIATLAGFAVLVLMIPIQMFMGKLFAMLRRKMAVLTDERVKLMTEIVNGMRVVKMYCWEKLFTNQVKNVRKRELRTLMYTLSGHSTAQVCGFCGVKLPILLILRLSVELQHQPNQLFRASNIFPCILLLHFFNITTSFYVPNLSRQVTESAISISRLQGFLLLPELSADEENNEQSIPDKSKNGAAANGNGHTANNSEKDEKRQQVTVRSTPNPPEGKFGMKIENFTAFWNTEIPQATLSNINLEVGPAGLVAVVGPVGAGKSSLLMSLLGELCGVSGKLETRGRVAYVSQQPWVFSETVRDNVLFGLPYEEKRYQKAVKAACLHRDLQQFKDGDLTMVGERGVSLSGGQRARVALARAVYQDADVYLLDDPLSAVDAHVGLHIFQKCINGVLREKCRLLVTHQVQHLGCADEIVVLQHGQVTSRGTYDQLAESGVDFGKLVKEDETDEIDQSPEKVVHASPERMRTTSAQLFASVESMASMTSDVHDAEEVEDAAQGILEEDRREGSITMSVYWTYFRAGCNIFNLFLIFMVFVATQAVYWLSDYWLAVWSRAESRKSIAMTLANMTSSYASGIYFSSTNMSSAPLGTNMTVEDVDTNRYMWIFTALILGVLLLAVLRCLLFFLMCVGASRELHNRMFRSLMGATVYFYDTNPAGRVLNRYSKDIGMVDDVLPLTIFDYAQCIFLVGCSILVVLVLNFWMLIPFVPIVLAFLYVRNYYLSTSRDVKRLESTARSPVFSHVNTTLMGLTTVRSSGNEEEFVRKYFVQADTHSRAWFMYLSTSRWFGIRLDWLCALLVSAVAYFSVMLSSNLDAGLVGLSLTYAIGLMGLFQWCVRQSAEVENHMISVERIKDYCKLDQEEPLEKKQLASPPPPGWPNSGSIIFRNTSFRYHPDQEPVLRQLNFEIADCEKIGVVGRTGAGKSSLLASLFRLAELDRDGSILVDGVDISVLELHKLRHRLSIIPQDPVLFTGTIRCNLDPFRESSDQMLWSALEEVQLRSAISALPEGLEHEVNEGGTNFSVGQRQLICLARALLRNNRILVVDEATANVDPQTDALIQNTLRSKFSNCTVLTIAHRLHTVMDSDRLLVMDAGQVAQLGKPTELLTDRDGPLYAMLQALGSQEADMLTQVAINAAQRDEKSAELKVEKAEEDEEEEVEEVDASTALLESTENPVV